MFKQIRDYSGTRDSRHLGASAFIASATKQLPSTDVWCILYPSLRHFVRSDLQTLTEQSLLLTLKSPVGSIVSCICNLTLLKRGQMSRQVFDGAVTWAMKADKTHFWKSQSTKSKTTSKPESAKEGLAATARKSGGPRASVSRTEEYVSVFFHTN